MTQKCPCPSTDPLAQTVYPLQGCKVHPNFENKKNFRKKFFSASTTTRKIRWIHWWNPFLRATAYAVSAHMLSQFRPTVRLSVCLSVTPVIHAKTAKVRIMQFSPSSSPIPLVFGLIALHSHYILISGLNAGGTEVFALTIASWRRVKRQTAIRSACW